MASIIEAGNLQAEQLVFGYSPAWEALLSLHILAGCTYHPLHVPWVLRARHQLSPALKAEAEAFRLLYTWDIAGCWDIPPEAPFPSFGDAITAFQRMPLERYAAELITLLFNRSVPLAELLRRPDLQHQGLALTAEQFPSSLPMVQEFLADPERSRQRFCAFLAAYWEPCLVTAWPQLEEHVQQDIERRRQTLRQHGVLALLSTLAPWDFDPQIGKCIKQSARAARLTFTEGDQLFLVPSFFPGPTG